jgi:hypothetical protein
MIMGTYLNNRRVMLRGRYGMDLRMILMAAKIAADRGGKALF